MSFNGSGVFQINSFGQPVVAGTLIEASVFNLFTQDIAGGLSNVITLDGQSATTVRIPFAFGINSSLVDNAVSANSGSIISQGGIGVAKDIWCAGVVRGVGGTVFPNPTNAHAWTIKTPASNKLSFSYDLGTPALELSPDNSATFVGPVNLNADLFLNGVSRVAIEGNTSAGSGVFDIYFNDTAGGVPVMRFNRNSTAGTITRFCSPGSTTSVLDITSSGIALTGAQTILSGLGAPLTVDGAGANGVTFLLKQSGVNTFLFGSDKYWSGGNLNDLLISSTANVIVQANGAKRATFSATGLAVTGNVIQTGPAGNVNHTITALTTGFAYVDVANGYGTARLGMNTVGEGVVGTVSNLPLVFLVGNVEKMRLTSAGLDITGTLRVSNPNAAWQFGISGTTKGIRFYTSPSESIIEGVDNTLVGSYQPLRILGSILYFSAQGGAYASIGATGLTVFGTLSGLQSVATDYTALTLGQSSNVTAHAKLDFTTGSTNVIGRISSYYDQSVGTGALHFWTYAAATLTNSMTLSKDGDLILSVGNMGISHGTGISSYLALSQGGVVQWNLVNNATTGDFTIDNNGVAARLQINQAGSIRFPAYAGAGDRVLHVDAQGWITAV